MMNKKGEVLLRHIMILMIVFAGLMTLAALLVNSLANSNAYDNPQMLSEFSEVEGIGSNLLNQNLSPAFDDMRNQTVDEGGVISSFTSETGIISGAGQILLVVIKSPSYIGTTIGSLLESVGVNTVVAGVIKTIFNLIIYAVIIFVLISALLRGSKM